MVSDCENNLRIEARTDLTDKRGTEGSNSAATIRTALRKWSDKTV